VLLTQRRQGGLEYTGFAGEKDAEVHLSQRGPVYLK
jgi:hypothetical protein